MTAAERRGALVIALLLSLGTAWDLWRAHRPPRGFGAPPAESLFESADRAAAGRPSAPAASSGKHPPLAPVDLNHAGADDLSSLPGIGPVLARRIIEARRVRGAFHRIEDLLMVRGIGPRLLERLRPHLALGERPAHALAGVHAFHTTGAPDSVQILLQSGTPAFR